MQDIKAISAFYHLELTSCSPTSPPDFSSLVASVTPSIERFVLFQDPQGLPPIRDTPTTYRYFQTSQLTCDHIDTPIFKKQK